MKPARLLKIFATAAILLCSLSITAAAETMIEITGSGVNIREGAATNESRIGSALRGDKYISVNKKDGWYQIIFPNSDTGFGWVFGEYAKPYTTSELPQFITAAETNVNVRSGAGTSYDRLGQLKTGTEYTVTGESGYWYKINYNGSTGYVAKWLCIHPLNEPVPPEENPFYTDKSLIKGIVEPESLHMRKEPSTEADIITGLKKGTKIAIYERKGDWYRAVSEKGVQGYVFASYITVEAKSSLQTAPKLALPIWNEAGSLCGNAKLTAKEDKLGLHINLSAEQAIIYTIDENAKAITLTGDMAISGSDGSVSGIKWAISGDKKNKLTVSSAKDLQYDITVSEDCRNIEINISTSNLLGRVIYLDPGHGSYFGSVLDPGAVGKNGTKERVVVLAIAKKLKAELEAYGAVVYLTHEGETRISRPERSALANKIGADIFVSIHANANEVRSVRGTSIYTYCPKNNTSYDRNARLLLAESIVDTVASELSMRNLGVYEYGYDVLVYSKMPAVLVETAFISNATEEAQLADPAWQQRMAEAITNGIIKYFDESDQ